MFKVQSKMYNFDKVIDRSGSDDLKHGALLPRWGRDDLLPLWVADMDFETPSFITDALKARLEHSLFGYTMEPEDYLPSIIDWVRDHHQWDVKREWIRSVSYTHLLNLSYIYLFLWFLLSFCPYRAH